MALINLGCDPSPATGWFDPVALCAGNFNIHWYGLSYLIGIMGVYFLTVYRAKLYPERSWTKAEIGDLIFYSSIGVIVGGRLGYVLFYKPEQIAEFYAIWKGGMSFHGGAIGVFVGGLVFSKVYKKSIFDIGDFGVVAAPFALFCGRMGNFINGELWGRPTAESNPFSMLWPRPAPDVAADPTALANWQAANPQEWLHPSQLYEGFFEGLVLLAVLWIFARKPRPAGAVAGLFVLGYGVARTSIEFFRKWDVGVDPLWGWYTRGMQLSTVMIIIGAGLIFFAYNNKKRPA